MLAAMLVASVLAVVAGSPAQAANTSFEVKYDHDNNAKTAAVREFAGQDRYDTALHLAKNFARSKGGLGSVPTAVLSSGETLVDSISVAGLAGYLDAPILLTPTGSLHGGVADFIEDYGVSSVYVLGGTAAISDATLEAIEALQSKPTATRVSGADRYDTAAKIAGMIGADSSWCGTTAKSAVLINGATDMMSYGVASQTIAYRLQLPVLMTAADVLPDATADFIDANDIDHVQIIGGADAVSDDVKAELTSLGVDTVSRVDGASAAEVSAALAKLAANGCGDSLGLVSTDRVALVRGNPDGVVAAPVLASSFAGGYLVSPLIVTDSLPASVRDYLAATPKTIGANKLNLGIVAVGGTAAVSQATMDAALEAAASSGALSVAIGATTNTNGDAVTDANDPVRPDTTTTIAVDATTPSSSTGPMFRLYFSDDILFDTSENAEQTALLAVLKDIIEINGVPAIVSNVTRSAPGGACDNRHADVTLGQPLRAGDVISVVASDRKLGSQNDQRTLGAASTTVTAKAPDRTRPTASILALTSTKASVVPEVPDRIFDTRVFYVTFSDAGGFPAMEANTAVSADDFTFVKAAGSADGTIGTPTHGAVAAGATSFEVTVPTGRDLALGDRLIVKPGVVSDGAKPPNVNAGTSGTAIKAQASPRIVSVQMSNLLHSVHNVWSVPQGLIRGEGTTGQEMRITAKPGGDAAGAAGNEWTMLFDRASTYSTAKPLDIDVRVDPKGKRVTVQFVNGPTTASLGDLLKELNGHAGFAERFTAAFRDCDDGDPTTPLNLMGNASGDTAEQIAAQRNAAGTNYATGRTQFAIEVHFSSHIERASHNDLIADLVAEAAARTGKTNDNYVVVQSTGIGTVEADNIRAKPTGGEIGADGTLTAGTAGGGLDLVYGSQDASDRNSVAPTLYRYRLARFEGETALMANLPMARDLVTTTAGATALLDDPNTTEVETNFRPSAESIFNALSLDDTSTTALAKIDQSRNGASQVRIVVNPNVKGARTRPPSS